MALAVAVVAMAVAMAVAVAMEVAGGGAGDSESAAVRRHPVSGPAESSEFAAVPVALGSRLDLMAPGWRCGADWEDVGCGRRHRNTPPVQLWQTACRGGIKAGWRRCLELRELHMDKMEGARREYLKLEQIHTITGSGKSLHVCGVLVCVSSQTR